MTDKKENPMKPIDKFLSDAKASEFGFVDAFIYAAEQFQSGNRNPMAKLLLVCNGKPCLKVKVQSEKLRFASVCNRLFRLALPNVVASYQEQLDFGVKWGVKDKLANCYLNTEIMERLAEYKGRSPFSKGFREAFPAPAKDKPEPTPADLLTKQVKRLEAWAKKEGLDLALLVHALQAKPTAKPEDFEPSH